jgi:protease-4
MKTSPPSPLSTLWRGVVKQKWRRVRGEILFAFLFAVSLTAQVRSPNFSDRALTPGLQIASTQDTWSLFTNPAGLSFVNGSELVAGYTHHWGNPPALHQGAFGATFGLFEGFSVGLGMYLSLPDHTTAQNQGLINGQFSLAYRFGRAFSLGLWAFKQRQYALDNSDPFLFGFGFQYYPAKWISLGATSKQVYGGFGSPLEFQTGVSIRPFGDDFSVFAETRFWPSTDKWPKGYEVDPIVGIRLDLEGFSILSHVVIQKTPLFMFGIDINLDHFGLSALGGNDYAGGRLKLTSDTNDSIAPDTNQWTRADLNSQGTLETPSNSLLNQFFQKPASPLFVLNSLDKLADDPKITGIFIKLDNLSFGFGRAEELRGSLIALRNKNKQVVVYLNNPNPTDYYVATAADRIYLNPAGELNLNKFRKTLVYFKKGLDELGVEADVITAGAYKSAPRPLIANSPSPQEQEVTNAILDEQYSHFIEAIAQKSQKSPEHIKTQINLGMLTASEALDAGLVDSLLPLDEVPELKNQYTAYFNTSKKIRAWGNPDQIAIIPISGTIIAGKSQPSFWFPQSQTGADDTIAAIEHASKNPRVKGIVLRIDSPGGDAFGSDQIYRAILKARSTKPVIASMADVAASGGYYAAAGAHEIWAEPSTITGSIGVFSVRFSAPKLFTKLGVSSFEFKRGALPGPTLFRSLSPEERARGQELINANYARFKQAVAHGQNLELDLVSKLAEGRVWTGEQAYANKLIQNIGGFPQALEQVKSMAGISDDQNVQISLYQTSHFPSFNLNPFSSIQDLVEHQGRALTLMPYIL